jgi:hypothetical protein
MNRPVQIVRAESIIRALEIKRACLREPDKFEPVPDRPILKDRGKEYRLADNRHVRADMAVVRAFAHHGPEYGSAVAFRMEAANRLISDNEVEARKLKLVRGEGEVLEVNQAVYAAAADAPCSWTQGFQRHEFFKRASGIAEGA